MKKGFTLIELIAVITFITLIILVSTPLILNQISTSRETKFEVFQSDLCLAAEAYLTHDDTNENDESFDEATEQKTVTIAELIAGGYLKSNTINPRTNQPVNNSDYILVTINDDGGYTCEFQGVATSSSDYMATTITYDNANTGINCNNAQCAVDKIAEIMD